MKPACIPPDIKATCIDPTPDGVTCFSYSHCLNVRSGTYYNNADPCDPKNTINTCHADDRGGTDFTPGFPDVGAKLPNAGASLDILMPIVCTVIIIGAWLILKKVRGLE